MDVRATESICLCDAAGDVAEGTGVCVVHRVAVVADFHAMAAAGSFGRAGCARASLLALRTARRCSRMFATLSNRLRSSALAGSRRHECCARKFESLILATPAPDLFSWWSSRGRGAWASRRWSVGIWRRECFPKSTTCALIAFSPGWLPAVAEFCLLVFKGTWTVLHLYCGLFASHCITWRFGMDYVGSISHHTHLYIAHLHKRNPHRRMPLVIEALIC